METVRQDVYLYNEANGWVITSGNLNGVAGGIGEGEEWEREFARGTFLPLVQGSSMAVPTCEASAAAFDDAFRREHPNP